MYCFLQNKIGNISKKYIVLITIFSQKYIVRSSSPITSNRKINNYRGLSLEWNFTTFTSLQFYGASFISRCKLNVSLQKLKLNMSDSRIINLLNFIKNLPRPKSYTVLDIDYDFLLMEKVRKRLGSFIANNNWKVLLKCCEIESFI